MPSEDDVIVSFRAPKSAVQRLDDEAEKDSRSRSAMLLYLIENIATAVKAIRKEKANSKD